MGITNSNLRFINELIASSQTKSGSMLSLGYPDILADRELWPEGVAIREDSARVCAYHGLAEREIPETYDFFARKGWTLTVTDYKSLRNEGDFGQFFTSDLNYWFRCPKYGPFDIVLDAGTMEHVFNVVSVLRFIADHLKIGGHVVHINPMQQQNHGFYNYSPTFYNDFYTTENSFRLVSMVAVGSHNDFFVGPVPPVGRFIADGECNLMVAAQKTAATDWDWPIMPIQSKYKRMLE